MATANHTIAKIVERSTKFSTTEISKRPFITLTFETYLDDAFPVSSLPTGLGCVHSRRPDQQMRTAQGCGSDSTTLLKLPAPCRVQIHHGSSAPSRQTLFPFSREANNPFGTFDLTLSAPLCARYFVFSATLPLLQSRSVPIVSTESASRQTPVHRGHDRRHLHPA